MEPPLTPKKVSTMNEEEEEEKEEGEKEKERREQKVEENKLILNFHSYSPLLSSLKVG